MNTVNYKFEGYNNDEHSVVYVIHITTGPIVLLMFGYWVLERD